MSRLFLALAPMALIVVIIMLGALLCWNGIDDEPRE